MKICCVPASSISRILTVPSLRQEPVPIAAVKLLFIQQMVPWTNFWMSLHIWPVVGLSQMKKTESVSKWNYVFNCSDSTCANDVVKLNAFAPSEMPKMSHLDALMMLSLLEVPRMLTSPLEAPEIPWGEPLEMPPLEELVWTLNWWHPMTDRIPRIPSVDRSTKNKDMSPQCGVLGHALKRSLARKDRQEAYQMLWEYLALKTLAVTPSSSSWTTSSLVDTCRMYLVI
jgi:hypothetical protein